MSSSQKKKTKKQHPTKKKIIYLLLANKSDVFLEFRWSSWGGQVIRRFLLVIQAKLARS